MTRSRNPQGPSIAPGRERRHMPAAALPTAGIGVALIAAFTASACLFLVELFAGRLLLPRFGGAPAVWVTCLAFFQAGLVAAYWFADRLTRRLPPARQVATLAVLFAGAATATVAFAGSGLSAAVPATLAKPVAVLVALAATVGPAFLTLAALAPMFGHWAGLEQTVEHVCRRTMRRPSTLATLGVACGRPSGQRPWMALSTDGETAARRSPHRPAAYALYAAGNAGSFAALIAYPWVVEPLLGLSTQAGVLAGGFITVAALGLLTGLRAARAPAADSDPRPAPAAGVGWRRFAWWATVAAIPASWLASITTHATVEIAPLPLLWVVPLAIYIGSFVVVCSQRGRALARFEPAAVGLAVVTAAVLVGCRIEQPLPLVLALHAIVFFVVCVGLHGLVFDDRPAAAEVTTKYLALASGGACGGLFNALIAPLCFDAHHELPLGIAAAAAVVPWRSRDGRGGTWLPRTALGAAVATALLLAFWRAEARDRVIHRTRTFFGVLRVTESDNGPSRALRHGGIAHGEQLVSESRDRRSIPLLYYHQAGPLGSVFAGFEPAAGPRRVGVAGLGVGAIAAYARPGDSFAFFEIDPAVVRIASDPRWFTHLDDCPGSVRIVVDDARFALAREPDAAFDLLVIDVFTGDAIPTHLLTREAFRIYGRTLAADGVLAIHVSNRYLDLVPLVEALALAEGWMALDGHDREPAPGAARASSHWIALGRSRPRMKAIFTNPTSDSWRWEPLAGPPRMAPWTDDWSPVASCLRE